MTVCIAAVCQENSEPKIVLCADSKSSSALGSTDHMNKIRIVCPRPHWYCLVSGAETDILSMVRLFKDQFLENHPNEVGETTILPIARKALAKRKLEKTEEFIQGRYALSYSEFLASRSKFPEDLFRHTLAEVNALSIEGEFILTGFGTHGFPYIAKTDQLGTATFRENFATIGEGAYLAQASLLSRGQGFATTFERTLYNVYEAKRFAEGAPTVGRYTFILILQENRPTLSLTLNGLTSLDAKYQEFGRKPVGDIKFAGTEFGEWGKLDASPT